MRTLQKAHKLETRQVASIIHVTSARIALAVEQFGESAPQDAAASLEIAIERLQNLRALILAQSEIARVRKFPSIF